MTGMIKRAAIAALLILTLTAGLAVADSAFLARLLKRSPAALSEPAMSALALEACLKLAATLDRDGAKVASDGARIEKLTAERAALQNQINAELDQLSHYDSQQMAAFQRRVTRNDDVERELHSGGPAHEKESKAYDEAVAGFERSCSGSFRAGDLTAAKAELGLI